ncbi:MAG: tRNA glutamyl-Q(34) synthetase GluQRS, partial [Clostridia bacterium]|nr:tRNA glutamyl-Q(34) synthetase GluQRS [Clostridia bacterium]
GPGMDLLDSTPRQRYLYELLGLQAPEFYHIPLLTAPDGRRLSKREKDLDLGALRQTHTPEQLLGKLAHLAGVLETPEPASAQEIAQIFAWKNVKTQPIVMDGF